MGADICVPVDEKHSENRTFSDIIRHEIDEILIYKTFAPNIIDLVGDLNEIITDTL